MARCAPVLEGAEPSTVAVSASMDGPQPGPAPAPVPPPSRPAVIAPLAPERYKVQVTISRETHDKLRRVQDLLRHQVPDGDPAVVFDRALTLLLQDLETNAASSSSITWSRLPRAARRRSRTSNFAAGRTTRTRQRSISDHCSCARTSLNDSSFRNELDSSTDHPRYSARDESDRICHISA